eukprot:COSAG06_NODE_449_length_15623_cov_50.097204_11_plen_91_part_00
MDADGGWSSELAYAALAVITTEPIGALVRVLSLLCRPVYDCSFIMPVSFLLACCVSSRPSCAGLFLCDLEWGLFEIVCVSLLLAACGRSA